MPTELAATNIGRLWAGHLYGTNTGKLFVEIAPSHAGIGIQIKLNDDLYGPHTYAGEGAFDGEAITVIATEAVANGVAPTITLTGHLTPEGMMRGRWDSSAGTAGTFALHPHDVALPLVGPNGGPALIEELNTSTREVGAIRMSMSDLREVIRVAGSDFRQPRPVITYRDRGKEVAKYAGDFEKSPPVGAPLKYIRIFISEPEAFNINRVVTVELDAGGKNEVRVQGVQEAWVTGKAESLRAEISKNERKFLTTTRRFGLNINGVLLIAAVCALPNLPDWWRRLVLMGAILAIIQMIAYLHRRYISNVVIDLTETGFGGQSKLWPQILSSAIAATASLAGAIIYGLLKGDVHIPHFLH